MHNFTATIGEICYTTKSDGESTREWEAHQLIAGISSRRATIPQWITSHTLTYQWQMQLSKSSHSLDLPTLVPAYSQD